MCDERATAYARTRPEAPRRRARVRAAVDTTAAHEPEPRSTPRRKGECGKGRERHVRANPNRSTPRREVGSVMAEWMDEQGRLSSTRRGGGTGTHAPGRGMSNGPKGGRATRRGRYKIDDDA